ncbi:N-acetylmuramoyl-L-alanine amidase [Patescibacteria group bacterium]
MRIVFFVTILAFFSGWLVFSYQGHETISGAPPYGVSEVSSRTGSFPSLYNWKRPSGPAKVAIQVGHWQNDSLPEELKMLRDNNGAQAGGVTEVQVNLKIARLIASDLSDKGIEVEILPATVPENYWSDVFLAIHADGSEDKGKSGYKFATSWRDTTRKADQLINILKREYGPATNLQWDDNITKNMRGYYAFAWWRFDHAIHPMTTPVILETGFLTNTSDRNMLVKTSEIPADAISRGVLKYLQSENLI